MSQSHHKLYQMSEIYDIAFDFKDFKSESEFMLSVSEEVLGRSAESWLELAAGPARHTIEMARRGIRALALDLAPEIALYGNNLASACGVNIEYTQDDVTVFQLDESMDKKIDLYYEKAWRMISVLRKTKL